MKVWGIAYTIAILLLFSGIAQGETFYETSFRETGYGDFAVEGPNERKCTEINFIFPKDLNTKKELFPIMSLNITFAPTVKGNAIVDVKLNDLNITSFSPAKAGCFENICWKRIILPQEALEEETNAAEICLKTSNTIIRAELLDSSLLGLYASPRFSLQTIPEKKEMVLGETLDVRLVAENNGSEQAETEFQRAREIASDKNAFRVVDGETLWQGTIMPGEKREILYTIKPKVSGQLSLPPAILSFVNVFGEQETIFSAPAPIRVKLPEKAIEAKVIKKEETSKVGEKNLITIALKNKTEQEIQNVIVGVSTSLSVEGIPEKTLSLAPLQTTNVDFTVIAETPGVFDVGCNVKYSDVELVNAYCEKQGIVFEEEGIPAAVIAGILLVAIAIAAYAFIHFSK